GVFNIHLIGVKDAGVTSCASTLSQNVTLTVNPLPSISFSGIDTAYCTLATPFPLSGKASPSGGDFTIDGNPATTFNPIALGVGMHVINYSYTDVNSCANSANFNVHVKLKPDASFTGLDPEYCLYEI